MQSVQPADWLLRLEIMAAARPTLQCNVGLANGEGEKALSKHSDVCTDVTVQIYSEGKCSISWAF